jgi:hypothetical protein
MTFKDIKNYFYNLLPKREVKVMDSIYPLSLYYQGVTNDKPGDPPIKPLLAARYEIPQWERYRMVSLSRYYEKNSPIQNRLADIFEEFVIGKAGIQFIANSTNKGYNKKAQALWDEWVADTNFEVQQAIAARTLFVDGEVFIVNTRRKGERGIRLVETQEVCGTANDNKRIIDGIEYDLDFNPVRYYIRNLYDDNYSSYAAEDVIHIYTKVRPNQLRGLPYCYPVLDRLKCLEAVIHYEMNHSRLSSTKSGFLKKADGEAPLIETRLRSEVLGDKEDKGQDEETLLAEEKRKIDKLREIYGGDVGVLDPGDDFVEFATARPSEGFIKLYNILLNDICEGQGIGKIMYSPESYQGTVTRTIIEINKSFFDGHTVMIGNQLKRVFSHITSTIPVPQNLNWNNIELKLPRSIVVDIGRDSAKEIEELKAGLKSFQTAYSERGLDWRTELTQNAEEADFIKNLAKEYGLSENEVVTKFIGDTNTQQSLTNDSKPSRPTVNNK